MPVSKFRKPALSLALALFVALAGAMAEVEEVPLATISYVNGPVTITREGKNVAEKDIGDPVYDDDYLQTGPGATLSLQLAARTGMKGSITMSQKSSLYLRQDLVAGERQNQAEMIAGQVSLKVKKLVGSPGMTVVTETVTCGVRGTEFEVTLSEAGDILVACTEGEVACLADGDTSSALPGQVVERRVGAGLTRRAMAMESYAGFRASWQAERQAEFRRDARRNAPLIIGRYLELTRKLKEATSRLALDADLRSWAAERKAGREPGSSGAVLRQDVERVRSRLEPDKALLGSVERLGARIEALKEALADAPPALLRERLRDNGTIGDFLSRFQSEKALDLERMQSLRGSFRLLRIRQNAMEEEKAKPPAVPGNGPGMMQQPQPLAPPDQPALPASQSAVPAGQTAPARESTVTIIPSDTAATGATPSQAVPEGTAPGSTVPEGVAPEGAPPPKAPTP